MNLERRGVRAPLREKQGSSGRRSFLFRGVAAAMLLNVLLPWASWAQSATSLETLAKQLAATGAPSVVRALEEMARQSEDLETAALASFALGYAAYQKGDSPAAIRYFSDPRLQKLPMADHAVFLIASGERELQDHTSALNSIENFSTRFPTSILTSDVLELECQILQEMGAPDRCVKLLEGQRQFENSPRLLMRAAQAQASAGNRSAESKWLQRVAYDFPLSVEASRAQERLQVLGRIAPSAVTSPSLEALEIRAKVFFEHKKFKEALADYRTYLRRAPSRRTPPPRLSNPMLHLRLAECFLFLNRLREAAMELKKATPLSGEAEAEKLYDLAELKRKRSKFSGSEFQRQVIELEEKFPNSGWTEAALFSLGNYFLVHRDRARALEQFEKIRARFPQGQNALEAEFRVAWGAYRQQDYARAEALFKTFVARYPQSSRVVAAIYWMGRIAEKNDAAKAAAFYRAVVRDFGESSYAQSAAERLSHLPSEGRTTQPSLDWLPLLKPQIHVADAAPADGAAQASLERAALFEKISLLGLATRELKASLDHRRSLEAVVELAHIYTVNQNYGLAMATVRQAFPDYFRASLDQLPRGLWRALFPLPYWSTIQRHAERKGVDPFLVAALIRQESAFDPFAKSRAKALGLMQLLPREARRYARKEKIARWSLKKIYDPEINIQLGIAYLADTIQRFEGNLEQALAAYNAGDERVIAWREENQTLRPAAEAEDSMEFIESIPFTETREYVQILLRNLSYYRKIYAATGP